MKVKTAHAFILFVGLIGSALQTASAAPNVSHQHEGRTHSHSLPVTGVKHFHRHMHNGRAHIHPYSESIGFKHTHNNNPRAKAWANAVNHEHGGRPHSHPLPKSGVKHQHKHKHGGRTHIHPLPVDGAKHFHTVNRTPAVQQQAPRITGLSIKKQMAAVLNVSETKILDDQIPSLIPRPKVTAKKTTKNTKKSNLERPQKTKTSYLDPRTVGKVLAFQEKKKPIRTNVRPKPKQSVSRKPKATKNVRINSQKRKLVTKTTPAVKRVNQTVQVTDKTIKSIPTAKRSKQEIEEGNRQFSLALGYEKGKGVKKNLQQALNWYQRSAKNGNPKAQYNLARLYENGEGIVQNPSKAIHWYTAAANNGDVNAQLNLGNRYAEGKHVNKNIRQAAKWYKRAADQGDMRGRANLNYLIEDYNGVIKQ